MTSPLQIRNKSTQIENKAREVFLSVKREYQKGIIQSETEYLYRIHQAMQDFYTSIGKPTMQLRPAWGPPFSQDYNDTMTEVYNDINNLYTESLNLSSSITEEYRQVETDRQNLDRRLREIENRVQNIEISYKREEKEVLFRDSFINRSYYNVDSVEDLLAHIGTEEGVLMLQPVSATSYSDGIVIRLLEGSNGFPGNTHQARVTGGTIRFYGEDSMHDSLADMLDGNTDTWFEYEAYDIQDATKDSVSSLGFNYKEGTEWLLEHGDTLKCLIELEMPSQITINWFSLKPFIPNDKGASPAVITSLQILDGKGGVREIVKTGQRFDTDKVFLFGQEKCKSIVIKLEQSVPYETNIGHLFFQEVQEKTIVYMEQAKNQGRKRIDGPYPSVEMLGYEYDIQTKSLKQPSYTIGSTEPEAHTLNEKKEELFNLPSIDTSVMTAAFEMIPAWRYAIAIRDANVSSYRFAETSEYRSISFQSEKPITSVSLEVDVDIPESFGAGEWVKYFISIDEGKNWMRIYPRNTTEQGAKVVYQFNTETPQEARLGNVGYADPLTDVTSIQLRMDLSRPSSVANSVYSTPVVYEYRLYAITQGGVFE